MNAEVIKNKNPANIVEIFTVPKKMRFSIKN